MDINAGGNGEKYMMEFDKDGIKSNLTELNCYINNRWEYDITPGYFISKLDHSMCPLAAVGSIRNDKLEVNESTFNDEYIGIPDDFIDGFWRGFDKATTGRPDYSLEVGFGYDCGEAWRTAYAELGLE